MTGLPLSDVSARTGYIELPEIIISAANRSPNGLVIMCSQGTGAYVIKRARVIEQATGRYVSSYTCAKISARARWAATPVIQIEPVTGNILAVYRSPMDAGESINSQCFRKNDLISTCARLNHSDGVKTSLGYIWRYKQ